MFVALLVITSPSVGGVKTRSGSGGCSAGGFAFSLATLSNFVCAVDPKCHEDQTLIVLREKPGPLEVVAICDHFIALSAAEVEYKMNGKALGFAHGDNKCRRFSLICDGTLLLPIPPE